MNDLDKQLVRAVAEKERSELNLHDKMDSILALMGYADNAIEEQLIKEKLLLVMTG